MRIRTLTTGYREEEVTKALDTCPGIDPVLLSFLAWARGYAEARCEELGRAHGGPVSFGCAAIVESAAMAMASSRYLYAKAAETGNAQMFCRSAQLGTVARQHEIAAWTLAAREAPVLRAQAEAAERMARVEAILVAASAGADDAEYDAEQGTLLSSSKRAK